MEELIRLFEDVRSEIDAEDSEAFGVWHCPGAAPLDETVRRVQAMGHEVTTRKVDDLPALDDDGEWIEVVVDGEVLNVATYNVWHGGPNSGSREYFWRWYGDTRDARETMRQETHDALEHSAKRMLDSLEDSGTD